MLGKPGSGKSTYAKIVSKGPYIAPGEMMRAERDKQTELGKQIGKLIDVGEFSPDYLTNELIYNKLIFETKENIIFDGYPRNLSQAEYLFQLCQRLNFTINKVIYLLVEDDIIINRLKHRRVCLKCHKSYNLQSPFLLPPNIKSPPSNYKTEDLKCTCGGSLFHSKDDKPEFVQKRLNIYMERTDPLTEYYKDILVSIPSTRDIDLDVAEISKHL